MQTEICLIATTVQTSRADSCYIKRGRVYCIDALRQSAWRQAINASAALCYCWSGNQIVAGSDLVQGECRCYIAAPHARTRDIDNRQQFVVMQARHTKKSS